ncbi:DUF84 family protein [Pseudalkalibacillus hwajinpoensis]|uniref:DUF84 family protein n=1 Tax=Guptibacillus hwajinpoensis TaxID=208199 RepID=UPI00325B77CD
MKVVRIAVGSENPVKINAVKAIFGNDVQGLTVPSGVSEQPWGDDETLLGAKNRAVSALREAQANIGIGLEGGVQLIGETLYVCNWGALVDEEGLEIVAGGARFPLPEEIKKQLALGEELGPVISRFESRADVNKKEGAIGIFTDGAISRTDMYEQIIQMLFGQYKFYSS